MKKTTTLFTMDPNGYDVYGEIARLRALGDVVQVDLNGIAAWAITSYDLQRKLFSDQFISRDPRKHWTAWRKGEVPTDWPLFTWLDAQNMFTTHGTEHKRLRDVVARTFTPRRINMLRPRIEQVTDECLEELALRSENIIDLCPDFNQKIPISIFCDLMGITGSEMRGRMFSCIHGLFHTAASSEEVINTHNETHALIKELILLKRKNPSDDLTSALISARAEEGDKGLTEDELIGTVLVMMMGGYETTANLLGNAVIALLTHPEQRALLNNSISWQDIIEETLRYLPSVANLPLRFAVADINLGSVVIPEGEAIIVGLAAAGRDPAFFGDTASQFDATRANKRHLSFGHGIHFCLGAQLARLEAEISLSKLFEHFPDIKLAEPITLPPLKSWIMNGVQHLPVRLK